jgi:uncharacterized membrane protein
MTDASTLPRTTGRVALLDVARTVALVGMAVYHFVFDLMMFGYVAPGTAVAGGWAIFSRTVASSFLILVGISLYLAHGRGIRWRPFLRRLAQVAGAAALISVATWYALGQQWIFFGILHSIALSSLLGLVVLRWPSTVLLALSVAIFVLPRLERLEALGSPWLTWLGLGTTPVYAVDFLPVFPWFAPVLLGIALAKILTVWGPLSRPSGRLIQRLGWPGRHSLIIYLIHQPILIGIIWAVTQVIR